MNTKVAVGAICLLLTASSTAIAQRQAKREAKIAESAQPKNVKGGATFQVTTPYDCG
jgi:hypothetical protein